MVEKIDENTLILHQLHKKVWPAAQRESLFWTHLEDVGDQKDEDALDAFVVCNHNVERDDVPVGLKVIFFFSHFKVSQLFIPKTSKNWSFTERLFFPSP